jgi:hypothetical protein
MRLAASRPSMRLARCAGGRPGTSKTCARSRAPVYGQRAEPDQVGKERHLGTVVDEAVGVPDLAVDVAEGRVGELQRDVRL